MLLELLNYYPALWRYKRVTKTSDPQVGDLAKLLLKVEN